MQQEHYRYSYNNCLEGIIIERGFIDVPHQMRRYAFSSQGLKVGNTIPISGLIAVDADGNIVGKGVIEAQEIQVYSNIKAVLSNPDFLIEVSAIAVVD